VILFIIFFFSVSASFYKHGVCDKCGLGPLTLKLYLKAKEVELWKLKYFTMQRYNNLQKNKNKNWIYILKIFYQIFVKI